MPVSIPVTRGPPRSRSFRLPLGRDAVSGTGTARSWVALPFAVLRIGGSAAGMGYVSTANTGTMLVFPLVGAAVLEPAS